MSETRDAQIAEMEAQLLKLRSEAKAEAKASRSSAQVGTTPEPGPAELFPNSEETPEPEFESAPMYAASRHPDLAHELITASGHAVGGHAGLGAGLAN